MNGEMSENASDSSRTSEEPAKYRVKAPQMAVEGVLVDEECQDSGNEEQGQQEEFVAVLEVSDDSDEFEINGEPMTVAQRKEACRLGFASGHATLREVAERFGFLYHRVRRWSMDENWSEGRQLMKTAVATDLQQAMSKWLSEEKMGHIRRSLARSVRAQGEVDKVLEQGDIYVDKEGGVSRIPLGAKAMQSIAMTEERLDLIIRRNLGMEDQGNAGHSVNVNVLSSGTVQIASL